MKCRPYTAANINRYGLYKFTHIATGHSYVGKAQQQSLKKCLLLHLNMAMSDGNFDPFLRQNPFIGDWMLIIWPMEQNRVAEAEKCYQNVVPNSEHTTTINQTLLTKLNYNTAKIYFYSVYYFYFTFYSYMLSNCDGLMKETILLLKIPLHVQQTAPCDVLDTAHKSNLYYQPCSLYSTCADAV